MGSHPTIGLVGPPGGAQPDLRPSVYAEVCANYRAIDDLRLRLLGLLPLATGAGILLLLSRGAGTLSESVAAPAGMFGVLTTISLFLYELHGIEKCAHFIHRAQQLEKELKVRGSFTRRPHHVYIANELLPAIVIYPASLAGWIFVALVGLQWTMLGIPVSYAAAVMALLAGMLAAASVIFVRENARPKEWEEEDLLVAKGIWPE